MAGKTYYDEEAKDLEDGFTKGKTKTLYSTVKKENKTIGSKINFGGKKEYSKDNSSRKTNTEGLAEFTGSVIKTLKDAGKKLGIIFK
jgi:hypothetical protein